MNQIISVFDKNYLVCNKCKVFISFQQEIEQPSEIIETHRDLFEKYFLFSGKEIIPLKRHFYSIPKVFQQTLKEFMSEETGEPSGS